MNKKVKSRKVKSIWTISQLSKMLKIQKHIKIVKLLPSRNKTQKRNRQLCNYYTSFFVDRPKQSSSLEDANVIFGSFEDLTYSTRRNTQESVQHISLIFHTCL